MCAILRFLPQTFTPKLVLLDFTDTAGMQDVAADVVECYGCVDILICNSSMKVKAPVQNLSLEMDRNIMDMNYFGPATLVKGENIKPLLIKMCLVFANPLGFDCVCRNNKGNKGRSYF